MIHEEDQEVTQVEGSEAGAECVDLARDADVTDESAAGLEEIGGSGPPLSSAPSGPLPRRSSDLSHETSDQPRTRRRRHGSGGRVRSASRRLNRIALGVYPDEYRDMDAIASHWDMATGTLAWGVISDWLARQRRTSSEVGELRSMLQAGLELALRDAELGPWLRGLVERDPYGSGS